MRSQARRGRRAGSGIHSRCRHFATVVAVAALACVSACGEAEQDFSKEESPTTVETITVVPETLRDEVALTGQLEAEFDVVLKPEVSGVIESIEFDEGKPVEEGDVLFRLRDDAQRARYLEAKAELRLAQDVFNRTQRLTNQDVSSLARKAEAAANLDVAKAKLALAKVELDRTEIRAPFSGVADIWLVAPGDRVDDENGLVRIDAIDRLQLVFTTQEAQAALARVGAKIHARVAAYGDERFPGTVFFVSPRIEPASRRLILKAWIDNANHRLKPGMFANVDVMVAVRPDALLVPEASIVYDRNGSYVWRVDSESRVEKVPVEIGLRQRGRVEIVDGLAAGDRVVSAGTNKLMAGTLVDFATDDPVEHAREGAQIDREAGAES